MKYSIIFVYYTTKIIIKGSELKAHKIPPSILTLLDDGTVGEKAVDNENKVIFYKTKNRIINFNSKQYTFSN